MRCALHRLLDHTPARRISRGVAGPSKSQLRYLGYGRHHISDTSPSNFCWRRLDWTIRECLEPFKCRTFRPLDAYYCGEDVEDLGPNVLVWPRTSSQPGRLPPTSSCLWHITNVLLTVKTSWRLIANIQPAPGR